MRFVVHQQLTPSKHASGLFVAAGHLLDNGELFQDEREQIEELLDWFRLNLPVPHTSQQDARAIYWFKSSAKPHIAKMWELTYILERHGYGVEMVTTEFAGLAIYPDNFQVGSIPRWDRHR